MLSACDIECLPFYNLTDNELRILNGIWTREIDFDTDLYHLMTNPDKFDERDSDNMLNIPTSNY